MSFSFENGKNPDETQKSDSTNQTRQNTLISRPVAKNQDFCDPSTSPSPDNSSNKQLRAVEPLSQSAVMLPPRQQTPAIVRNNSGTIILFILMGITFLFVPTKYAIIATISGIFFFFLPRKAALIIMCLVYALFLIMASLGMFTPPPPPPMQDDSLKTEHATIVDISAASLLKVKVLGCDPSAKVVTVDTSSKGKKKKSGSHVMEAGPCEFYILTPAKVGLEEFNVGDYATFQRTRNPVKTIFQTETVMKQVYRNEGDLRGFDMEKDSWKKA
eukprot:MONOS_12245.1-p1 / transcript=MONOS_12245.1 / gene=MONOS_12245 / organism=Monocercomonoides_exilis_PA203 / gene_product=unspecified product / transcript_product=unspecified product / location=Mono_scaffold00665:504-1438(-) / protein_length=272 / sequence_SO=supercontig / SO=protein_coding / is_pseudo=false